MTRSGIQEVPCLAFSSENLAEIAQFIIEHYKVSFLKLFSRISTKSVYISEFITATNVTHFYRFFKLSVHAFTYLKVMVIKTNFAKAYSFNWIYDFDKTITMRSSLSWSHHHICLRLNFLLFLVFFLNSFLRLFLSCLSLKQFTFSSHLLSTKTRNELWNLECLFGWYFDKELKLNSK